MEEKLKKHLLLLFFGTFFFLFSYYQLGIKKNLELKRKNHLIEQKISNVEILTREIFSLNAKLDDSSSVDNNLHDLNGKKQFFLTKVGNLCKENKLWLKEFKTESFTEKQDFQIEVNKFTVQGDFLSLTVFLNSLERDQNVGNIFASSFFVEQDVRTKIKKLNLALYVEFTQKK